MRYKHITSSLAYFTMLLQAIQKVTTNKQVKWLLTSSKKYQNVESVTCQRRPNIRDSSDDHNALDGIIQSYGLMSEHAQETLYKMCRLNIHSDTFVYKPYTFTAS